MCMSIFQTVLLYTVIVKNVERELPILVLNVITVTPVILRLSTEKRKKYAQVSYQMPKQLFTKYNKNGQANDNIMDVQGQHQ
jgi:hypothetical protein